MWRERFQKAGSKSWFEAMELRTAVPIAWSVRSRPQILVALPGRAKLAVIGRMGNPIREVIWSSRISGAKMSAEHARQRAMEAAVRLIARSLCVVGADGSYGGRATVAHDRAMPERRLRLAGSQMPPLRNPASIPLDAYAGRAIRRSGNLRRALKCRSCKKGRYAPPVHMIKLLRNAKSRRISGASRRREVRPSIEAAVRFAESLGNFAHVLRNRMITR